jgi:hypothetical protein
MFDIRDYYRENKNLGDEAGLQGSGELEDDIALDIDNILRNRFDSPYLKDRFRHGNAGIDIIYPRIAYGNAKSVMKGPDHVRYLLSLYPYKSDFENIDKIVLRPRHIEFADMELMALYLRRKRILVHYLHMPHVYPLRDSRFLQYAEMVPAAAAELLHREGEHKGPDKPERGLPALWYLISIVSHSDDSTIDKFFVRSNPRERGEAGRLIREVSFYYSRHGY